MRKVLIGLLRPTYLNLRCSPQRFLQKRDNILFFLALAAAIAAIWNFNEKYKKQKRRTDSMQQVALAQSVQDCDEMIKRSLTNENGEDYLFCRSLVPLLQEFLLKRRAKITLIFQFKVSLIFIRTFCQDFISRKIKSDFEFSIEPNLLWQEQHQSNNINKFPLMFCKVNGKQ